MHKNATAVYDAHGRRTRFNDTSLDGSTVDIRYAYTTMNDVRRVIATYSDINGSSPVTRTSWFAYDRRNRLVVSNGDLVAGVGIVKGERGVAISYDRAGQRATASSLVDVGNGIKIDRTEHPAPLIGLPDVRELDQRSPFLRRTMSNRSPPMNSMMTVTRPPAANTCFRMKVAPTRVTSPMPIAKGL